MHIVYIVHYRPVAIQVGRELIYLDDYTKTVLERQKCKICLGNVKVQMYNVKFSDASNV